MLLVMNAIGIGRSLFAIYLGLLATTLPYVVFIVAARLHTLDPTSTMPRGRSARAR